MMMGQLQKLEKILEHCHPLAYPDSSAAIVVGSGAMWEGRIHVTLQY
jgi:hypothetical protein